MKKKEEKTSKKSPKWVLRLLTFIGRSILLLVDYLDDQQINGSSLEMFNRLKSMFESPDEAADDDSEQLNSQA